MSQEKERLLARRQKIEQRLAAIQEAEERRREKDERRKAELAGRAVLKHAARDERFAAELRAILDSQIAAASARALFGLPPAGAPSASVRVRTRVSNRFSNTISTSSPCLVHPLPPP